MVAVSQGLRNYPLKIKHNVRSGQKAETVKREIPIYSWYCPMKGQNDRYRPQADERDLRPAAQNPVKSIPFPLRYGKVSLKITNHTECVLMLRTGSYQ